MLSEVSNAHPAGGYNTLSDLAVSSWNLLMAPDNLVLPWSDNTVVDSRETENKAIADFRVESTSRFEAVLARNKTGQASSNAGGQSTLTTTGSSDRLDTEQGKYDTRDTIPRPTTNQTAGGTQSD